jgi:hypothetical protein
MGNPPTTEIYIGAAPNDGTGDPLRTAFDIVNTNYTKLVKERVIDDRILATAINSYVEIGFFSLLLNYEGVLLNVAVSGYGGAGFHDSAFYMLGFTTPPFTGITANQWYIVQPINRARLGDNHFELIAMYQLPEFRLNLRLWRQEAAVVATESIISITQRSGDYPVSFTGQAGTGTLSIPTKESFPMAVISQEDSKCGIDVIGQDLNSKLNISPHKDETKITLKKTSGVYGITGLAASDTNLHYHVKDNVGGKHSFNFGGENGDGTIPTEITAAGIESATAKLIPSGSDPASLSQGLLWSKTSGELFFRKYIDQTINLSNQPKNIVYVNSITDLPAPVGGFISLADETYYDFNQNVIDLSTKTLVLGESTIIASGTFITDSSFVITGGDTTIKDTTILYYGTSALFVGTDVGDAIVRLLRVKAFHTLNPEVPFPGGNGQTFSISSTDPTALVLLESVAVIGPGSIGSIAVAAAVIKSVRTYYFGLGFQLTNNTGIFIDTLEMKFGGNVPGCRFLDISGTNPQTVIESLYVQPASNEKVFYIDPAMNYTGIVVSSCPIDILTNPGVTNSNIFDTGSLDQTSPRVKFTGNAFIPDSTAVSALKFVANPYSTTVTLNDTPYSITTNWQAVGELEERFDHNANLAYSAQTANFAIDDTVTGANSGATGYVIADDDQGTTGVLTIQDVFGDFEPGEIITGAPSGGSATLDSICSVAKYVGLEILKINVTSGISFLPASGADTIWTLTVAKNDVPDYPGISQKMKGDTQSIQISIPLILVTGDTVCLKIERSLGAGNVTAIEGRFTINVL